MRIVLDEKIEINGRKIYCKVLGATSTLDTNKPFLLCIPGGPGFGHTLTELTAKNLEKKANTGGISMPNVILFDPLGCENSDPAKDIVAEYNMTNFGDIAAKVVECVKSKLCPNQPMDLRVYGGSFGSMTAMDLPMHRPQWLNDSSDIRMKEIISVVGPNGADDLEYARKYLDENFKQHAQYETLKIALNKILDGTIKDRDDYIKNVVFNLAPLYSDQHEKMLKSVPGKILKNFYHQVIPVMRAVNFIFKKLSLDNSDLEFMLMALTGCSIDVLNQFFRTQQNGFNLIENISQNLDLYKRVPICLISCTRDHMVDYKTALRINQLLPSTSAAIIFNEKHMLNKGPAKELYDNIFLGLLEGRMAVATFNDPKISQYSVSDEFLNVLARLNQSEKKALTSSTGKTFSTLGVNEVSIVSEQKTEYVIVPQVSAAPELTTYSVEQPFKLRP